MSYEYDVIEEMKQPELHQFTRESSIIYWTNQKINIKNFVFRACNETNAYLPTEIQNGLVRPYGDPNMWSTRFNASSEWIQIYFKTKVALSELRLTFDDDVNEDLINLHHHYTLNRHMPELIRDYRILYLDQGNWREVIVEHNNRIRHRVHAINQEIVTDALKIELLGTNGSEFMSLYEARAYGDVIIGI